MGAVPSASKSEDAQLESAVYREVVAGDLKGAIGQYKSVFETSKSRAVSARALFHIGQCFEKAGQRAEARAVYAKLVSQFADQTEFAARARAKLSAQSEALPGPPQLKFNIGGPGNVPGGWFMPVIPKDASCPAGASCSVVLVPSDAPIRVTGDFSQGFSAAAYRGKTVRLRARIHVEGGDSAQLWLSVDRPKGSGDRVLDRPVPPGDWGTSSVSVRVDEDATDLNFGVAAAGRGRVSLKDVLLEVVPR
jgi:hypothetical protein